MEEEKEKEDKTGRLSILIGILFFMYSYYESFKKPLPGHCARFEKTVSHQCDRSAKEIYENQEKFEILKQESGVKYRPTTSQTQEVKFMYPKRKSGEYVETEKWK